ncbi:hypothetical protein Q5530_29300 [Saccharothrix sp. BKS2]|uniref:hypothetical protein n=1 Tax=Saccharothrix sp. BKS2 TaxID=3064400 RepID=UPI0039E9DC6D
MLPPDQRSRRRATLLTWLGVGACADCRVAPTALIAAGLLGGTAAAALEQVLIAASALLVGAAALAW